MIAATLSHYRISEKVGEGGMGVVYRAHDERLDRDIAIKVLPSGTLGDEAARKRLRKEALALAKLNHPNIETVHDFDTQDGTDFLVTEYVPGTSLDKKLAGRPLPEKETLGLGRQLAEGLAAAHEHGVIHRDLKPANLRITPDGWLKILDFGLAKLLRPTMASEATASTGETRGVMGTAPYMAPEQLRGEPVDARTDIWGAGVVLYEMATGRRPFTAELGTRLADDILHQAPLTPSTVNHHVSPGLESIILKALEKDPERRYQSARDLAAEFLRLSIPAGMVPPVRSRRRSRAWILTASVLLVAVLATLFGLNVGGLRERFLGSAGPPQIRSLAVLPLQNLSNHPGQEYFVDGMTEALITELGKIGALRVISRQSTMQFKGTNKPLPEIARALRVDAVVEGSVLRVGDNVRVTAQLIEAETDRHLWAGSFDRELREILSLHSTVARAIASEVKVALTPEEQKRLAETRPFNPQAQEFYFRGRYEWTKRGEEGFNRAIQFYQQAIEKDPDYPYAYAGLADVYVAQPSWGLAPPSEGYPRARAMAMKALELDQNLSEPYATLGFVKEQYDRDWSGAEKEYIRALELNPNYATGHHMYGMYLSLVGRHEQAIAELEFAQKLDPLAPNISTWLGGVLYYGRRYDQSLRQLQQTAEMHPEFLNGFVWLAIITYERMGMHSEALAAAENYSGPLEDPSYAFVGWVYGRTGREAEAQRALRRLRERSSQRYIDPGAFAMIYAGLGKNEEALKWLERAHEQRGSYLIRLLKVDPLWDPLRDDSRFQDLLRRMNFPQN